MNGPPHRRSVAVVGRPNVGKSALFNRLTARRLAIVHQESGVTRDRLVQEVVWEDQRFELIDTGGVTLPGGAAARDAIEAGVRAQVDAALADAPVVIFVVDVMAGVAPLDLEVAALLRAAGRTVVVAANKADNPDRDGLASDFEELGFPVFPISAMHNLGLGLLMDAVLAQLPDVPDLSAETPLKVAVVGRPNVGKSSYINRLLRSQRVIVSDQPGTTRDSVQVPFTVGKGAQARHYTLVDTPGLRRAGKARTAMERYGRLRAEAGVAEADIVVLMLDAARGPGAEDKRIAAGILENRKGCAIIVNKWDLAKEVTTPGEYGKAVLAEMPFMRHCPVVFVSAADGYNIRRSIDVIDHVAAQVQTELPTGLLNRTIAEALEHAAPPAVGGKSLKIYYAVQSGRKPVRVRLFVNDPRRVKTQYVNYLVGRLRRRFGLEGAPVVLDFRPRRA